MQSFKPEELGRQIEARCPSILFSLLYGSARDGEIREGGDVDLALYWKDKSKLDEICKIWQIADEMGLSTEIDIGRLNAVEPVYRFEALNGRLLFTRNRETFNTFFSLTCREYEDQMASYERQRKYRQQTRL